MPIKDKHVRIDWIQEIISVDKATRIVTFRLQPDPRRYEKRRINGKEGFYDKFDDLFFPWDVIVESLPTMEGLPMYHTPPKIENSQDYVLSRKRFVEEFLNGKLPEYEHSDNSEKYLKQTNAENYIILSFDLVGSTKLSQEISGEKFSQLISLLSREITLLVHQFNGFVLKFTGDGCLCYFPEPNFIGMHDNAVDCASAIRLLIRDAINPCISNHEFPEINFRIGLDSGKVNTIVVGVEKLKQSKDLIGETINIACKIQAKAEPNEIYVGESVAQNVHVVWRNLLKEVNLKDWIYKTVDGDKYKVFKLTI